MSLNRHAKRRDANEPEIVNALEKLGADVFRLDAPADLLVGLRGQWYLMEVKMPKGRLTVKQKRVHATTRTQIPIVQNIEEALQVVFKQS